MKKTTEVLRTEDPYSNMVMNEIRYLRKKNSDLEEELECLWSRYEQVKGVLYFTFILSTLGILLVIENLLHPWLRTL